MTGRLHLQPIGRTGHFRSKPRGLCVHNAGNCRRDGIFRGCRAFPAGRESKGVGMETSGGEPQALLPLAARQQADAVNGR